MSYGYHLSKIYMNNLTQFPMRISSTIYNFLEQKVDNRNLLDLCCGTGHLAYYFLKKGYHVTGIDLSKYMLSHAKNINTNYIRAGKATFIHGDVTNFSLANRYSIILSTYDSLNHLDNFTLLSDTFKNAYSHLDENGYFIFDLNTKQGLSKPNGGLLSEDENHFNMAQSFYDSTWNKAYCRYYGFIKEPSTEHYFKYDETISNTIFSLSEVERSLYQTGFTSVYFATLRDLDRKIENPESKDRVFAIVRK
ncbi:class I SAM-dependent methyltransferase [Lentibacillus sp. CBA3610]|uniref:class I SAM-dependent DNA methyltransferase n=1 Tax=Lentibacillus sp. CBA3610 TaxID=2518176 RepID=UPI0015956411|nr:class I SAM-dependent methyltransferase [Lentibacillus sp. CBA3610]